ncbi:MAG: J domain-containing protein [Candidatus Limnocylindrales bacterium]
MTAIDPYRTLGLAPGASQAEIKVAYRRLAKLNHPDSAGERALPRFLAIQAAYEALVEDPGGLHRPGRGRPSAGPPAAPWQADASRARATREAYRARTRGARGAADPGPSGGRSGPGGSPPGATGAPRPDGRESSRGPAQDDAGEAESGARSRRSSRRPKATIGSTSYDGADKEPFDPAWEGATWYGAGSGTYWTLNPKEYADPRKHGPEYLARSKRGTGQRGAAEDPRAADQAPDIPDAPDDAEPTHAAAASSGRATMGSADAPGDRSKAGATRPADSPVAAPGRPPLDEAWPGRPARSPRPSQPPRPPIDTNPGGSATRSFEPSSSAGRRAVGTLAGRIGVAVLGWIPLAVGLAAVSDAVPVCDGVATICSDPLAGGVWLVDLLVLGLLIAVPRLGLIAAIGSLAFFGAGLLATPVLLAVGGARTTAGTTADLTVVLIAAWLGGVVLALIGRVDRPPWRRPRVR